MDAIRWKFREEWLERKKRRESKVVRKLVRLGVIPDGLKFRVDVGGIE